jgi:hypothetical protein
VGLSWSTIILQWTKEWRLANYGGIICSKCRSQTGGILNQVVGEYGSTSQNIWTAVGRITSNNTSPEGYLITINTSASTIFDCIIINSAEYYIITISTIYASALLTAAIASDCTGDDTVATSIPDTSPTKCFVTRDCTLSQRKETSLVDGATTDSTSGAGRGIVRNRASGDSSLT